MKLDWDSKKAAANLRKHGVSFQEAGTVFGDPMALTFDDPDHSVGSEAAPYLWRNQNLQIPDRMPLGRGRCHQISSAREMNKRERRIYEEG